MKLDLLMLTLSLNFHLTEVFSRVLKLCAPDTEREVSSLQVFSQRIFPRRSQTVSEILMSRLLTNGTADKRRPFWISGDPLHKDVLGEELLSKINEGAAEDGVLPSGDSDLL